MNNTDTHIKLYTDSSIVLAGLKQILNKANISCIIKDNYESGRLAGFPVFHGENELFIFEKDLEDAKTILEEFLFKKD